MKYTIEERIIKFSTVNQKGNYALNANAFIETPAAEVVEIRFRDGTIISAPIMHVLAAAKDKGKGKRKYYIVPADIFREKR